MDDQDDVGSRNVSPHQMVMEAAIGNLAKMNADVPLQTQILFKRRYSEGATGSPIDLQRRSGLELIVQNPRFWQTQRERTAASSLQFPDIVITWAECHGFGKI